MKEIFTRRSIRNYIDKPIEEADIQRILQAGMSAPSAGNQQPWHFIVVNDRERLNEMANLHMYSKMLLKAPLAIVVCYDVELEKYKNYGIQDCSAATQNMLLEATHLGIGSVWLGVKPIEDRVKFVKNMFDLPENIEPFNVIAFGYSNDEFKELDRFKNERIHRKNW